MEIGTHGIHHRAQQDVDNYEYELPSDFEDEEIDEDEAFNSEDERKYGAWFERDAAQGSTDDGSDDGSEGDSDQPLMDSANEPEDEEEQAHSELDDDEPLDEPHGDPGQQVCEQGHTQSYCYTSLPPMQVDALLDDVFGADASTTDSEDDEIVNPEQHAQLVQAVQGGILRSRVKDPNARVLSEAMQEGEFNVQPAHGVCSMV